MFYIMLKLLIILVKNIKMDNKGEESFGENCFECGLLFSEEKQRHTNEKGVLTMFCIVCVTCPTKYQQIDEQDEWDEKFLNMCHTHGCPYFEKHSCCMLICICSLDKREETCFSHDCFHKNGSK